MKVLNSTTEVKNIKIILADGTPTSISLQPRGGRAARLPEGAQIDPEMIAQYMPFLRTEPKLMLPATVPQESTPAASDE